MRRNLTKEERKTIEYCVRLGWKNSVISERICRDPSTISKEIQRNGGRDNYSYGKAHKRYVESRMSAKKSSRKLENDRSLAKLVAKKLKKYSSPEQVSKRLKREKDLEISHETIYQWIYRERQDLQKYLRCKKGKWRRRRGTKIREKKRRLTEFKCIETRPEVVKTRKRLGDWEGDTVIGGNKKHRILTYVDRKSGYAKASLLHEVTAPIVQEETKNIFAKIPQKKRHTITFDRGTEFGKQDEIIEKHTCTTVYRAHAYSSWERGCNENWNGLLRQFFPKGSDFSSLTQKDVDRAVSLLNHRPRKRLNFLTPHEVFVLNLIP